MDQTFYNRTYFVTGASSGIGRAICHALAVSGAKIILLGRNEDRLRETMGSINASRCLPLIHDLCNLDGIEAVAKAASEWTGGIDGLVYCAGIGGRARLRDTTPEFMRSLMTVNCFAFVELVRCLARLKKKADPFRALAISSLAALGHDRYFTAYTASKAALEGAARAMATELESRNTRVNIIRCAFVDTPMLNDPLGDFRERLKESGYQPLGLVDPAEVAAMALFLLGKDADKINGVVFNINAGASC